jgi:hypothetical protein
MDHADRELVRKATKDWLEEAAGLGGHRDEKSAAEKKQGDKAFSLSP